MKSLKSKKPKPAFSSAFKRVTEHKEDAVSNFMAAYINLRSKDTLQLDANTFNLTAGMSSCKAVVNRHRINDVRYINKYFEKINVMLDHGHFLAGCFESIEQRRERLQIYKIPVLASIYHLLEFVFLRVLPKIKGPNKLYFVITKGKGRLLTEAEVLGRLVCCGFDIVSLRQINGLTYFVAKKVKEPAYDMNPSYGPIYKMPRVGRGGHMIRVYKFRTMHPYAEYLQDYVIRQNGYSEIGKPAQDFRLANWGRFMRRYWLDELPQLLNVLKGEMCLVGARPLSKRFLAEYPEDLKAIRFKYKPGCVPPYVALLKQDVAQYIESERIYFNEKEKHPFLTDFKFFFNALGNILTNKIKSA